MTERTAVLTANNIKAGSRVALYKRSEPKLVTEIEQVWVRRSLLVQVTFEDGAVHRISPSTSVSVVLEGGVK